MVVEEIENLSRCDLTAAEQLGVIGLEWEKPAIGHRRPRFGYEEHASSRVLIF